MGQETRAAPDAQSAPADVTRALAECVRTLRFEEIPEPAREVASHCLLDFLGCALAGSREPLVEILIGSVVRDEGGSAAGIIGHPERATRLGAALANGAAAHALDFDDTHTTMMGHPSAPVLPALLALAETEGSSGRQLLEALVAGIELECRLGALLGPGHYAQGFHATATIGTFGASAACARLLALGEDAWVHVLGLAGTQAAGLKSAFGTMAKPLHAGRAASAGLLSALLARGGFTAPAQILETHQGFAATHAGAEPSSAVLDRFRGRFLVRDTLFKYHAACYLTHAAIEASRGLRDRHGFDPEKIECVEVRVSPALLDICNIEAPSSGLEGKFSLRATTALALLGEDTGALDTFSDSRLAEPRLVALRDRVRVIPTDGMRPTEARVSIDLESRRLEQAADTGVPARDLAEQRRGLLHKFLGLTVPLLGSQRARELADTALGVETLGSLAGLLRLLRPE